MKCAEQVRNVYGQVQMWKAIYRYIISTYVSSLLLECKRMDGGEGKA